MKNNIIFDNMLIEFIGKNYCDESWDCKYKDKYSTFKISIMKLVLCWMKCIPLGIILNPPSRIYI